MDEVVEKHPCLWKVLRARGMGVGGTGYKWGEVLGFACRANAFGLCPGVLLQRLKQGNEANL